MVTTSPSIVAEYFFKPLVAGPSTTAPLVLNLLEWHGEVENIKKDGTCFWCYANASVFDHPRYGKVLIAVHTDITERKKVEEAFSVGALTIEACFPSISPAL